jgi:hypothetical protein
LLESSRKSKLYSLPEKLIDCETKKFPLLINDEPIKNCHLALVKEKVIDLKAKKLHSDFIYGHDLSSRDAFIPDPKSHLSDKHALLESNLSSVVPPLSSPTLTTVAGIYISSFEDSDSGTS